jgi:hypothetical protein
MYLNVKRYGKVLAVFLGMCIVLSGCSKKTEETTNDISSVKLKSNQEIVACKITAIYGNEIEYTVVKEQSASDSNSKKGRMPSASGAPDMNGGSSQGGGAPDMNGGEMPQGGGAHDTNGVNLQSGGAADINGRDSQSGGITDNSGENLQGGDASDNDSGNESLGNSSLDKNSSQSSSDSSDKKSDSSKSLDKSSKKIYTLTDETGSTTIPVGTDVITSLGKTTTFSRLSNGDIIKMIMEKDSSGEKVVVGVWIVS